ncbi:MAG: sugar transferase [Pirellulaceae bacterium]|nr:sugar transferase [Planctomycetaceae bacterium]HIM31479.1 sugar transferase [Planctomycetota bacterium]
MTAISSIRPRSGRWAKRVFDVIAISVIIVPVLPLMGLIALAIKWNSPGPILYRQRRLGVGEHPFTVLKFRSMRMDADRCGPQFTTTDDPRITSVGKLLRGTSLDELPQLFNVLLGDMSLIGPRPYVGFELEGWSEADRATRASVRPGISGMAQVSGRSDLKPNEIRDIDLDYVRRWSLVADVWIIWQTVTSVLLRKGVN